MTLNQSGNDVYFQFDKFQITQSLNNLIKNAIAKKKEILNRRGSKPLFTNDIDKKVRENFKIYL